MVSKSVYSKSQIEYIRENIGGISFQARKDFNAAIYNAIMVVTAEGLAGKRLLQLNVYRKQFEKLLKDVILLMQSKPIRLINRMQFCFYEEIGK